MRVLIVAPDLNPPWSEGRKTFVCDLLRQLAGEWDLSVLSTAIGEPGSWQSSVPARHIPCRSKATQLLTLQRALDCQLAHGDRPDLVLHFPFGTFTGMRGIANRFGIAAVDAVSRKHDIPCLTILYSMTAGSLESLSRKVQHLVAAAGRDWSGLTLNIGIDLDNFPRVWSRQDPRKLLFMAGYSENSSSLLRAILEERGLLQLIRSGDRLAEVGCTLSIAIPLLRFPERRKELQDLLARHAPRLQVELIAEGAPVTLYASHGMFVFPFRVSYTRFMPTSLLEAMACGIPVIASRLPMMEAVVRDDEAYCLSFAPDDHACSLRSLPGMRRSHVQTGPRT